MCDSFLNRLSVVVYPFDDDVAHAVVYGVAPSVGGAAVVDGLGVGCGGDFKGVAVDFEGEGGLECSGGLAVEVDAQLFEVGGGVEFGVDAG